MHMNVFYPDNFAFNLVNYYVKYSKCPPFMPMQLCSLGWPLCPVFYISLCFVIRMLVQEV